MKRLRFEKYQITHVCMKTMHSTYRRLDPLYPDSLFPTHLLQDNMTPIFNLTAMLQNQVHVISTSNDYPNY